MGSIAEHLQIRLKLYENSDDLGTKVKLVVKYSCEMED